MSNKGLKIVSLFLLIIGLHNSGYTMSADKDSVKKVYNIKRWFSGGIFAVGMTANLLDIASKYNKPKITDAELQMLDKSKINSFDRWALNLKSKNVTLNEEIGYGLLAIPVVLPFLLRKDSKIKPDFTNIFYMFLESQTLVFSVYEFGFLGPTYQNRYRPIVYYPDVSYSKRVDGNNRNSFYSGHVASATAATFFMVKVYSDYHPEIGNKKYLYYCYASIPPLLLSYYRTIALKHFPSDNLVGFGLGAIWGIVIPELHKIKNKNVALSLFSTQYGTGLSLLWEPKWKF